MAAVRYMVGDNPIADIQGGNKVGMITIQVNRADAQDANAVCPTLSDALAVVRR